MSNELRERAFEEMHHRLRQVRSYSLLDENGSQITVHAAIIKSDPLTESNPLNQETLGRAAAVADDDGAPYLWLDALNGKPMQLTLTQVHSLAESLSAFETTMYDFLAKISGEIDAGVITTFEQVDHAAWTT
jgi:hypothetical protein